MFGLDDLLVPITELPPEDRKVLADLLAIRSSYQLSNIQLTQMKIELLQSTDPAKQQEIEQRIAQFTAAAIVPQRQELGEKAKSLFEHSVDVARFKEMFPSLLMGLLHTVNVPLLLEGLGIDPDRIASFTSMIRDVLSAED